MREAIFNALGSLAAVEGARVLDAFAGSGALGIEALSRGAARATFVERDRRALEVIRANLDSTGLADDAAVAGGDVFGHLRELAAGEGLVVDLVLCDPPYRFDRWAELLDAVSAVTAPGAIVVAESDRALEPPAGWVLERVRAYGSTVVTFLRREPSPPGPPR